MNLFVVIPVYNRISFTRACLDYLRAQTYREFKTVVVDDGSTDGTGEMLDRQYPEVNVIKGDGNWWWSTSVNTGIQQAIDMDVQYVLTLNNDVVIEPTYLENLMVAAKNNRGSILGSTAIDVNNKSVISYCGQKADWLFAKLILNNPHELSPHEEVQASDFLPGRGLLIPREVFMKIGLFDALRFPQGAADYDFVWNAKKAGFPAFCCLTAKLYSYENETASAKFKKRKTFRNFMLYLFSKRSNTNIIYRIRFGLKNCPKKSILLYLFCDLSRLIVSYMKK